MGALRVLFAPSIGFPELGKAEGSSSYALYSLLTLKLPGFRTTRSSREFNPFATQGEDIILGGVDPVQIVTSGHLLQEQAYGNGEVDEVEEPAVRRSPLVQKQTVAQVRYLSSLLVPRAVERPTPVRYIPNMGLSPAERAKAKTQHRRREKRRLERWEKQQVDGTTLKGIASKKMRITAAEAVVAPFVPNCLSGWTGPRTVPLQFPMKVLSVPDALAQAGLKLVCWDGT